MTIFYQFCESSISYLTDFINDKLEVQLRWFLLRKSLLIFYTLSILDYCILIYSIMLYIPTVSLVLCFLDWGYHHQKWNLPHRWQIGGMAILGMIPIEADKAVALIHLVATSSFQKMTPLCNKQQKNYNVPIYSICKMSNRSSSVPIVRWLDYSGTSLRTPSKN